MVKPTAAADIIRLDFLGAAAGNARGFMRYAWIGKGAADNARPLQLVGLEGGCRADVGLRIEAQAHGLED